MFFIKYLRTLGFSVTNDIFADNAWYFRNSLVRENYNNLQKGIHETTEYLELFLDNLLLNKEHELHNRNMHVSGFFNKDIMDKPDIGAKEADIKSRNSDIQKRISDKMSVYSVRTIVNAQRFFPFTIQYAAGGAY